MQIEYSDGVRMRFDGRAFLFGAFAALILLFAAPASAARFDLDRVAAMAEKLAQNPFQDTRPEAPSWLKELNYDQWRDIRFRPERALWKEAKSRFSVQFFHPGMIYDRPITVNVVDSKGVKKVPFSPGTFDYGKNDFASRVPQDLGYAGFRVHYPMNKPDYADEVIVFLGASYLRAVAKDLQFGLSARALAIDTASSRGEEFPFFKEFWLVRPPPTATQMEIFALLDSPSAAGAYRFLVRPGEDTVVETEARIYPRNEIEKLGVAPLTSMIYHGENTLQCFTDFRPEVHDSDGMLVAFMTGEWLWRPIDNPERLQLSSIRLPNPRGFGLLQRDRDFDHYQDLETHMEIRPNGWVVPRDEWGGGHMELVEIPAKNEVNDNIVSYWVPERKPKPGEMLRFAYDVHWYRDNKEWSPGARVVATLRDRGTQPDAHRFIVDFEGGKLGSLPADTVVRGNVSVGGRTDVGEELIDQHVVKNPSTGGWRLGFQIKPKTSDPIELRAFLQKGDDVLTETWSYTLRP